MATLNIKNLPDGLYKKLQARARRNHRSLAQEVTRILTDVTTEPRLHSIEELRGLGKKLWKGIDPPAYIGEERSSWD